MAQLGLHAYISLKAKPLFPKRKFFFISFLLGSILPDIDIIAVTIASLYIPILKSADFFYMTITHSLITLSVFYLFFLIIYEIKKNHIILNIANGLIFGIICHILIDLIFSLNSISLFWPLPVQKIQIWKHLIISNYIKYLLLSLEFIFFRLFAYQLIKLVLIKPSNNLYYIKYLSIWMKIEFYLFLLFLIAINILSNYILLIFGIFYIPSILMSMISIYKLRKSI